MQSSYVELGQGGGLRREIADIGDGFVVVDRLQVVFQRLAADGEALLDHQRRFRRGEHVPLDGVGGIGQLQVDDVFQVPQPLGGKGAEAVEFCLLGGDVVREGVHCRGPWVRPHDAWNAGGGERVLHGRGRPVVARLFLTFYRGTVPAYDRQRGLSFTVNASVRSTQRRPMRMNKKISETCLAHNSRCGLASTP